MTNRRIIPVIIGALLLGVALALPATARTWRPEEVPNVQLRDARRYVSNPDGILSAGFKNVRNYVALVRKASEPDERVGYYGERVVLRAQQLGLRTCWVGLSYSKRRCKAEVADDEKLVCMLAIGYGENDGTAHKSRPADILGRCEGDAPEWFARGIEAVMLAPSAMNRQRFRFTLLEDGRVRAETSRGPYSDVDLGIAKLHFEIGAGKGNFEWA